MPSDVRITFPQYAAKWEERNGPNVRLTSICPFCDAKVTTRIWIRVDETPIPNETLLKQSAEDREKYWSHLITAHSEKFQD